MLLLRWCCCCCCCCCHCWKLHRQLKDVLSSFLASKLGCLIIKRKKKENLNLLCWNRRCSALRTWMSYQNGRAKGTAAAVAGASASFRKRKSACEETVYFLSVCVCNLALESENTQDGQKTQFNFFSYFTFPLLFFHFVLLLPMMLLPLLWLHHNSQLHIYQSTNVSSYYQKKVEVVKRRGNSYKSNSANAKTLKSIICPEIDFEQRGKERRTEKEDAVGDTMNEWHKYYSIIKEEEEEAMSLWDSLKRGSQRSSRLLLALPVLDLPGCVCEWMNECPKIPILSLSLSLCL